MYDMTIRLRTDSDKCLYQQIYEHIRQEIREGKLLASLHAFSGRISAGGEKHCGLCLRPAVKRGIYRGTTL